MSDDTIEEEAEEEEEEEEEEEDVAQDSDDEEREEDERLEDEKRTQSLISSAMFLLAVLTDASSSSSSGVLAIQDVDAWLRDTLLLPPGKTVRRAVATGLFYVCQSKDGDRMRHALFAQLLSLLNQIENDNSQCQEYFLLLARLARDGAVIDANAPDGGLSTLLAQLAQHLAQHPVVETSGSDTVDRVLCGLLTLTATLLRRASPELRVSLASDDVSHGGTALLDELFHRCLFDTPTPDNHGRFAPPKCKSSNFFDNDSKRKKKNSEIQNFFFTFDFHSLFTDICFQFFH